MAADKVDCSAPRLGQYMRLYEAEFSVGKNSPDPSYRWSGGGNHEEHIVSLNEEDAKYSSIRRNMPRGGLVNGLDAIPVLSQEGKAEKLAGLSNAGKEETVIRFKINNNL